MGRKRKTSAYVFEVRQMLVRQVAVLASSQAEARRILEDSDVNDPRISDASDPELTAVRRKLLTVTEPEVSGFGSRTFRIGGVQ